MKNAGASGRSWEHLLATSIRDVAGRDCIAAAGRGAGTVDARREGGLKTRERRVVGIGPGSSAHPVVASVTAA